MSKKKIFNLIELILHALMLIGMISLPYVDVRVDKTFAWAADEVVQLGSYTFFGYMQECPYIFATVFICLIVLSAIICLVSTFGKSPNKDGVVHTVLAMIILIIGFMFYIEPHYVTGYDAIPIDTTKTISLILLGAIAILSVMKRSNIAFPTSKAPITVVTSKTSGADELKKYKELLDQGVITQEEFDAKKKQLLGL